MLSTKKQRISLCDAVIAQPSQGRGNLMHSRSHNNKLTQSSAFQITESIQHKNLPKRMPGQAASSLSTLPIELAYRILDHLQPYNILVSAYSVCTRWNSIIDTYQPYQVKLAPSNSRNLSFVVSFLHSATSVYFTHWTGHIRCRIPNTVSDYWDSLCMKLRWGRRFRTDPGTMTILARFWSFCKRHFNNDKLQRCCRVLRN